MTTSVERAIEAYRSRFGDEPEVVASAPGRVNLIGEHTDYNGGFVLPCAIGRRVAVAMERGGNEVFSADFDEALPLRTSETPHAESASSDSSWVDYPRGVVWALGEAGYEVGDVRAVFAGDVPLGSGLSSSAAIEAATILALDKLFGLEIEPGRAALICQRAENGYVGVASGILDQYASIMCSEGEALFIDCRSLDAASVPMDLRSAGLSLLVCDTNIRRSLGTTAYNDRRSTCESASRRLVVEQLRDAKYEDLSRLSGEELKRARHIVTENQRVREAVDALEDRDFHRFGELMFASHASMRDDYEISTLSHDAFVELARSRGALGARLTGGGFGGCAITIVGSVETEGLMSATEARFSDLGLEEPEFYEFSPADGARVEPGA